MNNNTIEPKIQEVIIGNLADSWLMMYVYISRDLTTKYGLEGEAALRQGLREFGKDRGKTLREQQKALNMKINMYNLWTYYDLPADPRFKRNKIRLNEEERISQTLVCPMYNLWNRMNAKELGAIYCDEFHPAMFSAYHDKIVTNLGETLTHDTDDHCHFALYLRPANMDEKQRKESFAKYDPDYDINSAGEYVMRTPREGYNMLTIKLYYHLANSIIKKFGEDGENLLKTSIKKWVEGVVEFLKSRASDMSKEYNKEFLADNLPIGLNKSEDHLWNEYNNEKIEGIFEGIVYPTIRNSL